MLHTEYMQYQYYNTLQELLLEHADLFYHFKSIAPSGTITQDDIKEITDALLDDFRYVMYWIYYIFLNKFFISEF